MSSWRRRTLTVRRWFPHWSLGGDDRAGRTRLTRMSARPPSARSNRAHGSTAVVAWNAGWTFVGAGLGVANAVRHRVRGYRTPRTFSPTDVERNVDYVLGVVDTWRQAGLDPGGRRILEIGPGPDLGTGLVLLAFGANSYVAVDRFPLALSETPRFRTALSARLGVDVSRLSRREPRMSWVRSRTWTFDPRSMRSSRMRPSSISRTSRRPSDGCARSEYPDTTHIHVVDPQTHTRWLRPGTRGISSATLHGSTIGRWHSQDAQSAPRIGLRRGRRCVGLRLSVVDGESVDEAYVARSGRICPGVSGKAADGPTASNVQPGQRSRDVATPPEDESAP